MNCSNCNQPINGNEKFCAACGAPVNQVNPQQASQTYNAQPNQFNQPNPQGYAPQQYALVCRNCNRLIPANQTVCAACGTPVYAQPKKSKGSIAAFILGLIASIFGMADGLCMTMCSGFIFNSGVAPFILMFCGSILGLVGACICIKNALPGSILQLIAAIMIIICAYGITGSGFGSIIAMLLFIAGGLIGLITGIAKAKQ